jgi:hypothetical protein
MLNSYLKRVAFAALFFFGGVVTHTIYTETTRPEPIPGELEFIVQQAITQMHPDRLVTGSEYRNALENLYTLEAVESLFGGPGDILIEDNGDGYECYTWPGWRKRSIVECHFTNGTLTKKRQCGVSD